VVWVHVSVWSSENKSTDSTLHENPCPSDWVMVSFLSKVVSVLQHGEWLSTPCVCNTDVGTIIRWHEIMVLNESSVVNVLV
jgi:hypothetical protein